MSKQTLDEEYPFDEYPYKLVYKDREDTRKCYFQSEQHRTQHIDRYKLKKKDIDFLGYKFEIDTEKYRKKRK